MTRETLRWGNPPTGIFNAPVYLGLARGTLGTWGGRVEARDNRTGADYTDALVAGEFDMGHMGTPPLFAALLRTDEYAIVGQGVVRYPCFYVLAPPDVASVKDLTRRAVALNKLRTCPHSIIRTLLRWNGVAERDVELRTLVDGWRINEAIGRAEVAAAVNWEPYVSQAERVHGWRVLADGRTVIVPSNYGFFLYARRRLIAGEPGVVRRMVEDYGACVRYAMEHLDEAAATLYGRLPNILPEDVDRAIRRDAPNWTSDTSLDRAFLGVVLEELRAQGIIPADFSAAPYLATVPAAPSPA